MLHYNRKVALCDLNMKYVVHSIYAEIKGPSENAAAGGFRLKIVEQKL